MVQKEKIGVSSSSCASHVGDNTEEEAELQALLPTLERETGWDGDELFKYNGFWCRHVMMRPILSIPKHFKGSEAEVILASMPKSGTTWLKALAFSISTRNLFTIDQSPLLASNPHALVPSLEFGDYTVQENLDQRCNSGPRIFATHLPFQILPKSILDSDCPIIYICRNPLDLFISYRFFWLENALNEGVPTELDESFDLFCRGIYPNGPVWEHVLGYWNAHQKYPGKVLFLRYEDMQGNINLNVKKIAEFLGFPFSEDEEKQGLVEQISSLCSFENLSSKKVNKIGIGNVNSLGVTLKNSSFFRKGKVGDWTKYLTPAMVERMKKIVEIEFEGSGLTFEF